MIGKIFIIVAAVLSLAATVSFILSDKKGLKMAKIAELFYYGMTGAFIFTAMYLLTNILSHNFQFTYIWEYSSRELPDYFLVASFYSGQQGSFMLWTLTLTIIGLILIPFSRKKGFEPYVMGIYTSIIFFLLVILIFKSPFDYVWETFAGQDLPAGFTPENGRGLNPILQNYWITIHPPILFVGYSMMTIPFVFAVAGLIKRKFQEWIRPALPWTLVGTGILGLGIMLGGFWAYETLGWGGFWAWDPVENSSLIPWMIAVAFVHTMLVQRKTGGLVKTNILLGLLAFIFVLYATFLTRSGILGDTSVHSFVTPGALVYAMLVIFMLVYFGLGLVFFFVRWKEMNASIKHKDFKTPSKEMGMSLGSVLILAFAAIIIIGTSWPAIAEIFGQPKAAIDIEIYNRFGLVFGIVMMILNGFSIYQKWITRKWDNLLKKVMISLILAVISSVVLYFAGVNQVNYLVLAFSALFALFTNAEFIIRDIGKKPKLTGAYVAHIGVALLIFGALTSGVYDSSQKVRLKTGESGEALGYKFTFSGKDRIEKELQDREKYKYNIVVDNGKGESTVHPIVYWSAFNDWQQAFLEPGVKVYASRDVYVSPMAVEPAYDAPRLDMQMQDTKTLPTVENVQLQIEKFKLVEDTNPMDELVPIAVIVHYTDASGTIKDTLHSRIHSENWKGDPMWSDIPGTEQQIGLVELVRNPEDISKTRAVFIFKGKNEPFPEVIEYFTFEASVKPWINLVWAGTLAIVAGFFMALFRYREKVVPETKDSGNGEMTNGHGKHIDESIVNEAKVEN